MILSVIKRMKYLKNKNKTKANIQIFIESGRINILLHMTFLLLSVLFFCNFCVKTYNSRNALPLYERYLAALCVSTLYANLVKALRLYILLFGRNFTVAAYGLQYIKTAFVSLLLPLKTGELYRGYCMGQMIGSIADGYAVVLLDRFVDTLALVTVVFAAVIFWQIKLAAIYIVFASFLILLMIAYGMFQPLYQYWNHFLIFHKSSENVLFCLAVLEACRHSFEGIKRLVRGRFAALYVLSVSAWAAEIAVLSTQRAFRGTAWLSSYLTNLLSGIFQPDTAVYLSACLACLIGFRIALFFYMHMGRNNENNCSL